MFVLSSKGLRFGGVTGAQPQLLTCGLLVLLGICATGTTSAGPKTHVSVFFGNTFGVAVQGVGLRPCPRFLNL
jgi:hypothetical protein